MIVKKRIKTHCVRGHEVNESNSYLNKTSGSLQCRKCRQESQKRCRELLRKRSERIAEIIAKRIVDE